MTSVETPGYFQCVPLGHGISRYPKIKMRPDRRYDEKDICKKFLGDRIWLLIKNSDTPQDG